MAGIKYTYQDALDLAHAMAEQENLNKVPELPCKRNIIDVLGGQVTDLTSALSFLRDFYLSQNDRSDLDKRRKIRAWNEIYNTFFAILDINPKDSKGKKRSLQTVISASEKLQGTSMQDFYRAFDSVRYADEARNKENSVYEFLKNLEDKFILKQDSKKVA